jgi:DNA-directed RNA polymerase specialized sigma subunit
MAASGLNHDQRARVSLALWLADRLARVAARYSKRISEEDLIQIARTGLTESAVSYDETKDAEFERYARALRALDDGLATLVEADARILRRRWIDELDWPALAEEMGVSRSTAQRLEYDARQKLRRYLLSRHVLEMPPIAR